MAFLEAAAGKSDMGSRVEDQLPSRLQQFQQEVVKFHRNLDVMDRQRDGIQRVRMQVSSLDSLSLRISRTLAIQAR
jgi:hypothetical protein